MELQTEYEFSLPRGYADKIGNLQKKGIMRLANASDEILPLKDPRLQNNPSYLSIIVLARVIINIGDIIKVTPGVIESLFIGDIIYLQELYRRINGDGNVALNLKCPHCSESFEEAITAPTQFLMKEQKQ